MQIYILIIVLSALTLSTTFTSPFRRDELPSNGKIAFASNQDGDYDIYLINSDGSNVQQLIFNTGYDDQPVWSPDGKRILYTSDQDGDVGVFVMDADGSNSINLTPNLGSFDGRWSPDGTKIAFTAKTNSIGENIYVMNEDGSQKVNLTHDTTYINAMPFWSRDGNQLFFVTTREYPTSSGIDANPVDVYRMNADGSYPTKIFSAGIGITNIDLSPDGTQIAYGVWRLGPTLIVYDLDTQQETILVDGIQSGGADPAWSPDGTKIVFNSNGSSIATMDTDGNNRTILLNVDSLTELRSPSWEPLISDLQTPIN